MSKGPHTKRQLHAERILKDAEARLKLKDKAIREDPGMAKMLRGVDLDRYEALAGAYVGR